MGRQLFGLPAPKVLVRVAVLPHQGAAFALDEAPLGASLERPHDLVRVRLPRAVGVALHATPLVACHRHLVIKAALGGQADLGHPAEPRLEHRPVPAAEDDYGVPGVLAERPQAIEDALGGGRAVALELRHVAFAAGPLAVHVPRVRRQCPLVVQEEHAGFGVPVGGEHGVVVQLLEVLGDADVADLRAEADAFDADALFLPGPPQIQQEVLEPLVRRALGHVLEVSVVEGFSFSLPHLDGSVASVHHLFHVPRVDPDGTEQHPAATRELADDHHAVLGRVIVVRSDILERHQIQTSLRGRVDQDVRRAEHGEAVVAADLLGAEVNVARSVAFGDNFQLARRLVDLEQGVRLFPQRAQQRRGRVVPGGRLERVLHKHSLSSVVAVGVEELPEGAELRDEAAEVVAAVHADEDLLPLEQLLDLLRLPGNRIAQHDALRVRERIHEVRDFHHDVSAIVLQAEEAAGLEGRVQA
mmetsp:Transcript_98257/g.300442  ORF Transcript_98257/g.300442 Transcript_98257/m.300442 type:complete len:471 (+) Transcript_98257:769-2181(+)